jgi:hypothetical protein
MPMLAMASMLALRDEPDLHAEEEELAVIPSDRAVVAEELVAVARVARALTRPRVSLLVVKSRFSTSQLKNRTRRTSRRSRDRVVVMRTVGAATSTPRAGATSRPTGSRRRRW